MAEAWGIAPNGPLTLSYRFRAVRDGVASEWQSVSVAVDDSGPVGVSSTWYRLEGGSFVPVNTYSGAQLGV